VSSLTELQLRILAFERSLWRSPGAKERDIAEAIGVTPTRYYQILNELIDSEAAAAFDPELVARLRRRRAARGRMRSPD
jgi:DNA-binding MarR family transcriptional regulator